MPQTVQQPVPQTPQQTPRPAPRRSAQLAQEQTEGDPVTRDAHLGPKRKATEQNVYYAPHRQTEEGTSLSPHPHQVSPRLKKQLITPICRKHSN
ncbi:hypothetical protein JOB18_007077 [Solea senegalensis]|uniref:Uncharacterized protein n=1 Tax=Solea senegalensis TaxID=28829 RepID=A0AAV6T3Y2_SOLSE|nr:hypothetical protein JOB18_007077 [Solea senegalensis]